jgi:hypothetical protein
VPAIALTIAAILGGTLATYLYEDDTSFGWRLCAGACTGLGVLALIGFVLASWLGLTPLAIGLAGVGAGAPVGLLARPHVRRAVRSDCVIFARGVGRAVAHPTLRIATGVLFFSSIAFLLWTVFNRVLLERPEGISTGIANNFGDLPFHLGAISRFVWGNNFPPEDPTYAGVRFTYPFLADFVAAMFVRAGASLRAALLIENVILVASFLGVLYYWAWDLTRDRRAARLTLVLTLFSGGLGWWLLAEEGFRNPRGLVSLIGHLRHDFTIMSGNEWRWGNMVTTLLVPQRALLFGLPLALVILTEWWRVIRRATDGTLDTHDVSAARPTVLGGAWWRATQPIEASCTRRMMAIGAIAGLLPLVHAHSFVVIMAATFCFALLFGLWRLWAVFSAVAFALALPQIMWSTHGSGVQASSFLAWHLGWDKGADQNLLWFWFTNTGFLIPLTGVALFSRGQSHVPPHLRRFYVPFLLCFVVANVLTLAPWVWDNIKVLIFWYLASVPLVALVLVRLWSAGRWRRVASCALVGSLTFAGALDLWRVISHASDFQLFSRDGLAFAALVQKTTSPRALILHAPIHNHPVFLTGRRSLMGYPGHIWTHGLDYRPREADITRMYAGSAEAAGLLARYGVEYVVVGPLERQWMPAGDQFRARYPQVGEIGDFRLYRVAPPSE